MFIQTATIEDGLRFFVSACAAFGPQVGLFVMGFMVVTLPWRRGVWVDAPSRVLYICGDGCGVYGWVELGIFEKARCEALLPPEKARAGGASGGWGCEITNICGIKNGCCREIGSARFRF